MIFRSLIFTFILFSTVSSFSQGDRDSILRVKDKEIGRLTSKGDYDSVRIMVDDLFAQPEASEGTYWNGIAHYRKGKLHYYELDQLSAVEELLLARDIHIEIDSLGAANDANYQLYFVYNEQNELDIAHQYCLNGIELAQQMQDTAELYLWYNSLGNNYLKRGIYDLAMENERIALRYALALETTRQRSFPLSTIGEIHYFLGDYDSAEFYFDQSEQIKLELGLRTEWLYSKIGKLKIAQNKLDEAIYYCKSGYESALERNKVREQIYNCECLHEAYSENGDVSKAYQILVALMELKDLSDIDEKRNQLTRMNYEIQYKQQAFSDSIQFEKEKQVADAKLEHEKTIKTYLYLGLFLVLIFAIVMVNRFRVTQKQKAIIAKKKEEAETLRQEAEKHRIIAEEKNEEILDSITYAKRIQSAIMPPEKVVNEFLPENFITYIPKDIVAGDFYWLESTKEEVIFAAADCTGHGVPGAMVSVICNNGLNRSVREHNLTEPGQILDKTREIVIEEFEKSEEEVKDGMDIALCSLKGAELKYAGAHNPLWIIRAGSEEVEEIKANKQPIGKFLNPEPYATHKVTLKKGDQFYIFSDGYADQFGGDKGKKFKTSNFKKLLLQIKDETMSRQKELIEKHFYEWKGGLEQLDDVCVIGVRF